MQADRLWPKKRQSAVAVLLTVTLLASGCVPTGLTRVPPGAEAINGKPLVGARPSARIGSVEFTMNGVEQNPRAEFITRLQGKLDQTGLFSEVRFGSSAGPESVTFRFRVVETRREAVMGTLDNILVVLSVFLLARGLTRIQATTEVTLEGIRSDGAVKRYSSVAEGNLRFGQSDSTREGRVYLPGQDPFARPDPIWATSAEIQGRTLTAALNGLLNQVIADDEFYRIPQR